MTVLPEVPVTRPFRADDFYGYAGAERFLDGALPLITSRDWGNPDDSIDIVADVNGITAYAFSGGSFDEAPDASWWKLDPWPAPYTPFMAELILSGLPLTLTPALMVALGFEYMGNC